MTRTEILNKLTSLRYCVLWPGAWNDIEFTERPIWINHEGYGYYATDEPCIFSTINGISPATIFGIKEKIADSELTLEDIKNTPLIDIFEIDKDNINDYIAEISKLLDSFEDCIYCGADIDGWSFFGTEEELIQAFSKDSTDYYFGVKWIDMDDTLLHTWHERLFVESQDFCLPLTLDILRSQ